MKYLTFVPLILLAACAEKTVDQMSYSERKALAAEVVQSCRDQGVPDGHPEMAECVRVEAAREARRREKSAETADEIGLAIAGGLHAYGQGMAQSQATQGRPLTCTSSGLGAQVSTTCY